MDDSILNTIKAMLGLPEEYDAFDTVLVVHINSVFSNLSMIGAAPADGFYIQDKYAKWADFFAGTTALQNVKTLMYLRVRLLFDPPATSFGISAMERQAEREEWLLSVQENVFNPLAYARYMEVITDGSSE